MKTTKYIYLFFIAVFLSGGFITSCYDDSSTLDIDDIGTVEIDTTGITELSVYQFEHLVVEPQINIDGISESDLTYTWRINLEPNDTTFIVIGNEKNLDYEVSLKPNESVYYYYLTLTITNQLNGLDYMMAWETTVKNPLGEGLVVAESSDDANTDLSIIMSPELTEGYSSEKVLRHVYSTNNGGSLIDGLVKQMYFTTIYGNVNGLFTITDNSLVKIETFDYSYAGMNDDLFYATKDTYSPQLLGGIPQGDIYVGNHQLIGTYLGITQKFGIPFDFAFEVPDYVAINPGTATIAIDFYDESLGGFVYLPSMQSFLDHDMHAYDPVTGAVFDPASVPNKINLAAATNLEGDFLHLLQDKTNGDIGLYILDGGGYEYPNYIAPAPKAFFDLSDAPEIQNAIQFVFFNDQKVLFYATSTKIYAVLYGTSTPIYEERYTVPAGEEITTLQVYQQAGYPNNAADDPYISTNNRQLVMSTYSNEGKVYLLPFKNLGAANIDTENVKTFDGFGRITAITPQQ